MSRVNEVDFSKHELLSADSYKSITNVLRHDSVMVRVFDELKGLNSDVLDGKHRPE